MMLFAVTVIESNMMPSLFGVIMTKLQYNVDYWPFSDQLWTRDDNEYEYDEDDDDRRWLKSWYTLWILTMFLFIFELLMTIITMKVISMMIIMMIMMTLRNDIKWGISWPCSCSKLNRYNKNASLESLAHF